MKRMMAILMCLMLCVPAAMAGEAQGLPLQGAHRTTLTQMTSDRPNGAKVVRWKIATAKTDVDAELNALAEGFVEEMAPGLRSPGSSSNENSRLTVSIRPSRTGLTWLSFMVQARTLYHQKTAEVRFTTRTYDMATGERVMLTDVFPEDSAAWDLMAQAVRDRVNAYYPGESAPEEAVEQAAARESLAQMDFTFHGMSLVLHLDATRFYPGHPQLIEVPLYYPDVRPFMTEKAQAETDNLNYYYTAALTFDDGPNGWVTDRILQTLMSNGERATFFLVGERIRQQAFHVQRQHDEGHAVATHNWQHVYANQTPASQLTPMVGMANRAHIEAIGLAPSYCRAPGGHWSGMASAGMGWPLIQWSVEAQDWSGENGPPARATAGNIVAGTYDGGIILMHDLKENSIEATDMICKRLQEKGFILLTVDELFAKDGVTLEPDTVYWRCTEGETGYQ